MRRGREERRGRTYIHAECVAIAHWQIVSV